MEQHEADLLQALAEVANFLDRYRETRWAAHFRQCWNDLGTLIQEGAPGPEKAAVAARVRSVYGGMGSFRDLVIHPLNGHPVQENDVNAVNQTLDGLAGRIYDLSFAYQER